MKQHIKILLMAFCIFFVSCDNNEYAETITLMPVKESKTYSIVFDNSKVYTGISVSLDCKIIDTVCFTIDDGCGFSKDIILSGIVDTHFYMDWYSNRFISNYKSLSDSCTDSIKLIVVPYTL